MDIISNYCFIMLLFSEKIYTIWIGDKVRINSALSALMALFVIISTWNNIFAFFLMEWVK